MADGTPGGTPDEPPRAADGEQLPPDKPLLPDEDSEPLREAEAEAAQGLPYGEPGKPLSRSPFLIALTAGLGLAVAYVGYEAVRSIWSILVLIVVAGFLAIGLHPAVAWLQKYGLSRGLAVAVVALVGLLVSCGGLLAVIPPLVRESAAFIAAAPGYLDDLRRADWIEQLNERYDVLDKVQDALTPDNVTTALGGVMSGAGLVFGSLFNIVTIGILTLYFLAAFDRLKEGAYQLVPASRRPRARLLGDAILAKVGGYMVGSLLIAALAGLSSLVFMLITGIPYPLALALVVAICDLIPQVGATLGALVLTLVGLTVSVPVAIAALVFFLLYQQLENWVIYPKVMRRTTQVSDLAAILGMLVGGAMLGLVGVLIAIPATAAIQLIAREVVIPRQNAN
ncbi:MAG: AI-2E family transporter [Micromonosporaceae bacterium]